MPNWCEGNLRLRGNKEAIKNFLENELLFTVTESIHSSKTLPAVVITDDCGDLYVSRGKTKKGDSWDSFYIKDTHRNFIDGSAFYVYFGDDAMQTVCIDDFKAAWGVDPSPYVEKAKKYGVDIRIVGFEQGMQFMKTVEIVNGELVTNEEKEFDDWYWECPMPNMGG